MTRTEKELFKIVENQQTLLERQKKLIDSLLCLTRAHGVTGYTAEVGKTGLKAPHSFELPPPQPRI